MLEYIVYTKMLIGLIAVVNPVGAIPIFISLTPNAGISERRLMLPIKNNIGPDQQRFAYELHTHELPSGIETSRVEWHPELVDMMADEAGGDSEERGALEDAKDFLSKGNAAQ